MPMNHTIINGDIYSQAESPFSVKTSPYSTGSSVYSQKPTSIAKKTSPYTPVQ